MGSPFLRTNYRRVVSMLCLVARSSTKQSNKSGHLPRQARDRCKEGDLRADGRSAQTPNWGSALTEALAARSALSDSVPPATSRATGTTTAAAASLTLAAESPPPVLGVVGPYCPDGKQSYVKTVWFSHL